MQFEELWEDYLDKDITEIFDAIMEVFGSPLDPGIGEEYDLGEFVAEFAGHYEASKQHGRIEEFVQVLKHKQPALYKELGDYLNEALIKYYCFTDNLDKIKEHLADFTARDYDYDLLLCCLKRIQYHGHVELVESWIEQEFEQVNNSPDLVQGAEFELAQFKFYSGLESLCKKKLEHQQYDWDTFKAGIADYGFQLTQDYKAAFERGLSHPLSPVTGAAWLEGFPSQKTQALGTLEFMFLRYMDEKGCAFPNSGVIWNNLLPYFESKPAKNWASYFKVERTGFKKSLSRLQVFLLDNSAEIALSLWGSRYFLDFLKRLAIITEGEYKAQTQLVNDLILDFKKDNRYHLWQYKFVHEWKAFEGVDPAQREIEKEQFLAAYELQPPPMTIDYSDLYEESKEPDPLPKKQARPIAPKFVPNRKIGRNEKVSVKYHDGSIKKNVKYKYILKDLEQGICELL